MNSALPYLWRLHWKGNLLLAGLLLFSFAQSAWMIGGGRVHNNDFKHLWAGSRILAEGGDPYDSGMMLMAARRAGFDSVNPYVYLPATGFLMRPFTVFEFSASAAIWFWFNGLLAAACVVGGPLIMKLERPWLAQIAGAGYMAGAMPFYRQMTAGQMNVVILAALILTLGLLIRRRDFAAGAILGFAAAFKIAPIFLILVLAGMRRWRAAVASVIAFAAICAAAQIGTGWNALGAAIPTLRAMGYGSSTWASMRMDFYRDPFNQSYHSLLNHLLAPDDLNPASPRWTPWLHLGPWTATAATWIVSSVLLFGFMRVLLRYRRRPCFGTEWREGESALLLMAVMLMLLLPSIMWDHYMVQAMIVLMWLFGSRSLIHKPIDLGLAVGAFFLLAYPWMHLGERWSHGWGLLFMSVRLWGALILLHLLGRDWTGWMKERVG